MLPHMGTGIEEPQSHRRRVVFHQGISGFQGQGPPTGNEIHVPEQVGYLEGGFQKEIPHHFSGIFGYVFGLGKFMS
jgi:hypothetical protein